MMLKDTLLRWLKLDGLVNNLTGYVETRLELLKYEIRDEVATAASRFVLAMVMLLLAGLAVLTGSLALAFKLAEYYGYTAGFAITAGIYMVVLLVLFLLRKPLYAQLEQVIKSQIHKKE
jgi:uncharacterized membrane protein YqjE